METPDHVLVVDDDADIRDLLGDYLRKNGYRATAVADGKAMWAAFESAKPDIIVLDVMLPGDDGLTLCRDLRARSQVPIIMLTARGEETDRIVGLELGADDYLPKPFNPRELLARVKSILRRTRTLPENLQPDEARARIPAFERRPLRPLADDQLGRLPRPRGAPSSSARSRDVGRRGPRETPRSRLGIS